MKLNTLLSTLSLLLIPSMVWAHARLKPGGTLPPRTNQVGKVGPCGGFARTNNPTILQAGQSLTVQWEETIEHPGWYRIAFSHSGDQGFDQNVLFDNIQDTQGGAMPHQYSANVTIPNVPCTQCTLQLIQYMSETNPPSLYYSCADINIVSASGTSPSPSPAPSPTPSIAPASKTMGAEGCD